MSLTKVTFQVMLDDVSNEDWLFDKLWALGGEEIELEELDEPEPHRGGGPKRKKKPLPEDRFGAEGEPI